MFVLRRGLHVVLRRSSNSSFVTFSFQLILAILPMRHISNASMFFSVRQLIAKSESKFQAIVNCVKEKSSQAGLDMNVNKIKTMMISRNHIGKAIKVKVNVTTLEQEDQFK